MFYCVVIVCTVWYGCLFCGDQFFVDFIKFLIHDILYKLIWCLRYNICSAWFLDIRISTSKLTKGYFSKFWQV